MWAWFRWVWSMPIDKTKCCDTHTEEKEKSGTCCQLEDQEKAEQATYEHSIFKIKEQNE